MGFDTLLAEAFPLCFSAVTQRCTAILFAVLAARVLFWLFPRHRNNQNKTRAAKTAKRMAVQR